MGYRTCPPSPGDAKDGDPNGYCQGITWTMSRGMWREAVRSGETPAACDSDSSVAYKVELRHCNEGGSFGTWLPRQNLRLCPWCCGSRRTCNFLHVLQDASAERSGMVNVRCVKESIHQAPRCMGHLQVSRVTRKHCFQGSFMPRNAVHFS